jgi:hypothetical protein
MKRSILATAGIGFVGLILATAWFAFRHPVHQHIGFGVTNSDGPQVAAPFTGGEYTDGYYSFYFSSDGAQVFYGCSEQTSPSRVDNALRIEIGHADIIERAKKVNERGETIGTRIVLAQPTDMVPKGAAIVWAEDAYLFTIHAPSLKDAQAFEKWQATWKHRNQNCQRL